LNSSETTGFKYIDKSMGKGITVKGAKQLVDTAKANGDIDDIDYKILMNYLN